MSSPHDASTICPYTASAHELVHAGFLAALHALWGSSLYSYIDLAFLIDFTFLFFHYPCFVWRLAWKLARSWVFSLKEKWIREKTADTTQYPPSSQLLLFKKSLPWRNKLRAVRVREERQSFSPGQWEKRIQEAEFKKLEFKNSRFLKDEGVFSRWQVGKRHSRLREQHMWKCIGMHRHDLSEEWRENIFEINLNFLEAIGEYELAILKKQRK